MNDQKTTISIGFKTDSQGLAQVNQHIQRLKRELEGVAQITRPRVSQSQSGAGMIFKAVFPILPALFFFLKPSLMNFKNDINVARSTSLH